MPNVFDQFDPQPKSGGNVFDQFDATPAAPAAQQQAQQQAPQSDGMMSSIGRGLYGLGEVGLSTAAGMIATPINEATRGVTQALDMPQGNAPVGIYQPKTPEGQAIQKYIGGVVDATKLPQLMDYMTGVNDPNPKVQATGHLINAAIGALPFASAGGRLLEARTASRPLPAPARADVKAASQAAYDTAANSGEILPQSAVSGFVPKAEQMLAGEGFDKDLHPKTTAALNRVYEDATRPGIAGFSPQGAEATRRVLSNAETEAMAASAPGHVSSDARLAGKLLDEYDNFVDQNMPSTTASAQMARQLWAKNLKAQQVETIFERAKNQAGQYSVSGEENALRSQFKQLADNPRRFNRFTPDEKDAILKVVRGGPVQNALRLLGKFAPTGVVPALAALSSEGVVPGSGVALALGGLAARQGATAMRKSAAQNVYNTILRGPNNRPGFAQSIPTASILERLGLLPAGAIARDQQRQQQPIDWPLPPGQ